MGDFGRSAESVSTRRAGFGSSQGKPDYELGINRRNKLCRWVEVAGKIEFADSTALVGTRRDRIKWRGIKKKRRRKDRKKGRTREKEDKVRGGEKEESGGQIWYG